MPDDPMYIPVQVGSALNPPLPYIGDDTGDNISERNPYFCELTGLYWAWKNLDDDSLPVRISYAVEDAETAAMAQELLAAGGYSSSMDTEAGVLDVLYTQEQPVDVLVDCAGLDGVLYTGYCIAE